MTDERGHSILSMQPRSNGAPVTLVYQLTPSKWPSGLTANVTESSRCESLKTFIAKFERARKSDARTLATPTPVANIAQAFRKASVLKWGAALLRALGAGLDKSITLILS